MKNAKVADFGLSQLTHGKNISHITTNVKGTAGYLDPE
jgi:serine/threonine protein kinase